MLVQCVMTLAHVGFPTKMCLFSVFVSLYGNRIGRRANSRLFAPHQRGLWQDPGKATQPAADVKVESEEGAAEEGAAEDAAQPVHEGYTLLLG